MSPKMGTPNLLWAAIVPLAFVAFSVAPALAQSETKSSHDVAAQTDEFNRQKGDLLNRLKELKGKIDSAEQVVVKKGDASDVARQTIESMRAVVSPLLATVADNGEISQLGARALKNAKDRKAALEKDPRFSPEERQKLAAAWEGRVKATSDALAELEKVRMKFFEVMTNLQSKEDLIGEWAAIKAQDEVIATIKQLTKSLKDTSVDVQNFIAMLEAPGS
jgi:DNA-binding FrmR family transcriptional regulator